MRVSRFVVPACLLVLAAGCSNSTGPTAGILNVTLASPHSDDGAVLLQLSGGPVDSIESIGYPVYSARMGPDAVKLIVTGNLAAGAIARIHVPDLRQASRYNARLDQVAARVTYAQHDPAEHSVTLLP
ncbi:MAG TPA: hypothetical protein VJ808_14435 [Gemmatimonadales bacterium]|nr:hypothetical protein [Gemmatimonadales bacterium]